MVCLHSSASLTGRTMRQTSKEPLCSNRGPLEKTSRNYKHTIISAWTKQMTTFTVYGMYTQVQSKSKAPTASFHWRVCRFGMVVCEKKTSWVNISLAKRSPLLGHQIYAALTGYRYENTVQMRCCAQRAFLLNDRITELFLGRIFLPCDFYPQTNDSAQPQSNRSIYAQHFVWYLQTAVTKY